MIQLISELYKLNKDVQEYLSAKFIGEEAVLDLFEKTKKIIKDEFFPERGDEKLRLSVAKNAISNFKKVSGDELKTIDLMLFYVEIGTKFTNMYGDIDRNFYSSMARMYDNVAIECEKSMEALNTFKNRVYAIVEESEGIGWGYHDAICDIYYSFDWDDEEDYEDE